MPKPKNVLKIAVVGCGNVARNIHLPILARMRDVAVVALIDPQPSQCDAARQICPEARVFHRLDELWSDMGIDAVIVASSTDLHASLATDVVRRGIDIYLEKPIATELAQAERLIRAWQTQGTIGMIGFNYRFNPLVASARSLLADGAIGRPLAITTVFTTSVPVIGWRGNRQSGGGVLLDLGSHHVDLIHYLFGEEITHVYAHISSSHSQEGTAAVQMRLRNGVLVSSLLSFGSAAQDRIEVFGDRAILRIDRYLSNSCELIPVDRQQLRRRHIASALSFVWHPGVIWKKLRSPGHDVSYTIALQEFVRAVRTRTPAKPDLQDGFRALAIVSAAEESYRCGDWAVVNVS